MITRHYTTKKQAEKILDICTVPQNMFKKLKYYATRGFSFSGEYDQEDNIAFVEVWYGWLNVNLQVKIDKNLRPIKIRYMSFSKGYKEYIITEEYKEIDDKIEHIVWEYIEPILQEYAKSGKI